MTDQTKPPNYGAIPLAALQQLNDYFVSTPMPRKESDPFMQILQSVVPIHLEPKAAPGSGETGS